MKEAICACMFGEKTFNLTTANLPQTFHRLLHIPVENLKEEGIEFDNILFWQEVIIALGLKNMLKKTQFLEHCNYESDLLQRFRGPLVRARRAISRSGFKIGLARCCQNSMCNTLDPSARSLVLR